MIVQDINQIDTLIEPDQILFSFDAPGWIVLFYASSAIILILLIYWLYKYYKNKYRRNAIALLKNLQNDAQQTAQQKVSFTHQLLKQICLSHYNRQELASLTGDEWLNFLNSKTRTPLFEQENFEKAQEGLFRKDIPMDVVETFISQSTNWIKKHVV